MSLLIELAIDAVVLFLFLFCIKSDEKNFTACLRLFSTCIGYYIFKTQDWSILHESWLLHIKQWIGLTTDQQMSVNYCLNGSERHSLAAQMFPLTVIAPKVKHLASCGSCWVAKVTLDVAHFIFNCETVCSWRQISVRKKKKNRESIWPMGNTGDPSSQNSWIFSWNLWLIWSYWCCFYLPCACYCARNQSHSLPPLLALQLK